MAFSLLLHSARTTPARLAIGITGLPTEVSALTLGGLYAVRVSRADLRRRLIIQTALHSAPPDGKVAIVSEDAKHLIESLAGVAQHGSDTPKVQVFERPRHYHEAMQRYGAKQFIRELEAIELPPGAIVLIDGADELFASSLSLAGVDEARTYRELMRDLSTIGIFLFQRAETLPPASAALRRVRPSLSGSATLNGDLGRLSWDVDHWDSDDGTTAQRRFGVFLRKHQPWLEADGSEIDMFAERVAGARDESSVFYTRADGNQENGLPTTWRPLGDYAAAPAAMENAIGATLILHYADPSHLRELARTVNTVRRQCGRGVKILVRETGAHLRYGEELLVMRAGANAVVYRDQRLARLLSAVEALQGHCYPGPIMRDVDSAFAAITPEQIRGYVSPRAFCSLVRAAVARTGGSTLQHALLRLRIRTDTAHLDALTAWHLKRANDLVTADEKDVYLFLFGCREPDVDPTLQRLLGVPATALFSGQTLWNQPDAILAEVGALSDRAERRPFVDFSLLLPVSNSKTAQRRNDARDADQSEPVSPCPLHTPIAGSAPETTRPGDESHDVDSARRSVAERSVMPVRLRLQR